MVIIYKTKKLKRICTEINIADKCYGKLMAEKIHQRIDQIEASESIEDLIRFKIGRCHALEHNRKGQFAMDLVNPYRLVFEKNGDVIQIARILEIVDYHR